MYINISNCISQCKYHMFLLRMPPQIRKPQHFYQFDTKLAIAWAFFCANPRLVRVSHSSETISLGLLAVRMPLLHHILWDTWEEGAIFCHCRHQSKNCLMLKICLMKVYNYRENTVLACIVKSASDCVSYC